MANLSTWKFKNKEVEISELDEKSALTAILHCLKRIHYYHKRITFCEGALKDKESLSNKKLKWFQYELKKAQDIKRLFIDKLDLLEERMRGFGIEVPTDDFEKVKEMLSELSKEVEVHA